jgi:hypothetical protein
MPFENPVHPAALAATPCLADDELPSPSYPASLPVRTICRIVSQIANEMVVFLGERIVLRRDRRRLACHVRQISMYVSHVVLQLSLGDVAAGFGRDRTTVGHACHVVEDRRDDAAFDEFVTCVERMVAIVFLTSGMRAHD